MDAIALLSRALEHLPEAARNRPVDSVALAGAGCTRPTTERNRTRSPSAFGGVHSALPRLPLPLIDAIYSVSLTSQYTIVRVRECCLEQVTFFKNLIIIRILYPYILVRTLTPVK